MSETTLISVPKELHEHYELVKDLRDRTLNSPDSEVLEQVKAVSAVTALLKDLAAIQEKVYNSEKFAILTHAIIGVLRDTEPELAASVVETLENRLAGYN